jgi:hypothetical protein
LVEDDEKEAAAAAAENHHHHHHLDNHSLLYAIDLVMAKGYRYTHARKILACTS